MEVLGYNIGMPNIPARNPANDNNLYGLLIEMVQNEIKRTDSVMPAIVTAFDAGQSPPRVQVQPSVKFITTDGKEIDRAPLINVPVFLYGSNGFFLNTPLKAGDTGLLVASDRDISNFLQILKSARPNTYRFKNFSDAFFLPCALTQNQKAVTADGLSIQNNAGTTAVILKDGEITLKIDQTELKLTDSQVTLKIGGSTVLDLSASDALIDVSSRVVIKQNLAVQAEITAGADITPNTPP